MKQLLWVLFAISLAGEISSCDFGRQHTTITENDDHHYMKIEYSGEVRFNLNGTGIESISRGGYVKYRYDEQKLVAKNNGHGGISYELYDGDQQLSLDSTGKALIAQAVHNMMKKGHNPNWSAFSKR